MPYTLFVTNGKNKNNIVNSIGNQVTLNLNAPIQLDNQKNYIMRVLSSSISSFHSFFTTILSNFKLKKSSLILLSIFFPLFSLNIDFA